ncbi:ATP-binding cassette domain-containing protein [Streptomyces sp. NPDC088358]|uniref:ATP-binding cassette domain-containing protein n=1 Tax=Streptomyces sp. NPDC088358 TaxID=3365857 RepID=UPI00380AA60B
MYLDDWADFIDEADGHRIDRGSRKPSGPTVVCAEDATFKYPSADHPAVSGVSLEVRRGEVLALVGENSSGKTTPSKLLSSLYLPDSGAITWDGIDARELDAHAAWGTRRRRTAVLRELALVGAGEHHPRPTHRARGRRRTRRSSRGRRRRGRRRSAQRPEHPAGQVMVGRTPELSGRQWQRIALARAFHRPAGLLVLDEPTAVLDPRAEHRIITGLRRLAADRAVVLVTHRLTNVAIAERIVVLSEGHVIQDGTFDELLAQRGGLFRELWDLQNERTGRVPIPGGSDENASSNQPALF